MPGITDIWTIIRAPSPLAVKNHRQKRQKFGLLISRSHRPRKLLIAQSVALLFSEIAGDYSEFRVPTTKIDDSGR